MLKERHKIFVVDDDPFCLKLMENALRINGFEDVHSFESGATCLNALIEEPDIIFLDQVMDSVSGTDTLKAIKRFNPDIYVVFVSGQQQVEVAVESLKYGAFDYIVKDEQLTSKIGAVLAKILVVRTMLARQKPPRSSRLLSFFNLLSFTFTFLGGLSLFSH
ncbi:response regulator [Hymenobacter mucosus]|uniref:Response regulator receiver domain-containing protein n=1 Tax=Hymenobacter mucosus TaxID=1411120 RepID=A0A238Z8L2_9BACT|nr:response regulator [Hymenobacter mucosus]SNR79590.1 Response regulator receiver domain-containing protein [Hymenobacter mucosus]